MPKGVTKDLFAKFGKYYDKDVFIASTYRIRAIAKSADELDPTERIIKIAQLFSTFRNPDKETVLTPWRVVNMHMSDTIGGYDFFDEKHEVELEVPRLVKQDEITDKIFTDDGRVLEINSKTGLYPLYIAYTFYRYRLEKQKLSLEDKYRLWDDVIKNNVFVICKTPMAKSITKRTLLGYRSGKIRSHAFDDLINQMKEKQQQFIQKVSSSSFWNIDVKGGKTVKFNAIVGNPPYQSENDKNSRKEPVYHYFYQSSFKLSDIVTLITPARFLFNAGQTPSEWNNEILNDAHIKVVNYYENSHDIFSNVDIKGGIAVLLRNQSAIIGPIGTFIPDKLTKNIITKILNTKNFVPLSSIAYPKSSFGISDNLYQDHPNYLNRLTKGNQNILDASIFSKIPEIFIDTISENDNQYIRVLGRENNKRVYKFINKKYIKDIELLHKYKVFITGANGTGKMGEELSQPVVGIINDCSTQTFMSFGPFETEIEAINCAKYMKTKFLRFCLGTLKITQNNPRETWKNVPLLNFTEKSDIEWNKSVQEIDNQLYNKFGLDCNEFNLIEERVQKML